MTLTPGARLGPYEIVSPLGAGGMGEVYRAHDSRLGRDVAIKVLPQHLSANPELRARFEREARAVSSLNHPHICTLHDVGREGETDYLVLELVEGETLAQRLTKGALPAAEVLKLGAQIADALDRAHRAGVVHRDLKPGNVMLTKSGAKLMDFGLARATGMSGPAGGSGITQAALTQSPTVAAPLTTEGTIVGTFQYMAPEQLEGREADARCDLWALGCVLHEMATGQRAFEGTSQASLIAAIMHVTPAPISQVAPLSPPGLERVVTACLTKDASDRIQSAHDVKLQLQWIAEGGSGSGLHAVTASHAKRGAASVWLGRLPWIVGLLGLIAAASMAVLMLGRRAPAMVLRVPVPSDLQVSDVWSDNALSPNGDALVSVASKSGGTKALWYWDLRSESPISLPGTEDASMPAWSPDGRSIVFFAGDGLLRLPISGGTTTRIADASWGRGASWGRKEVIVFAPEASGPLIRMRASGGAIEQATTLDTVARHVAHRFPCFLPDGEHFLFVALPAGPRGFDVFVGSLGSSKVKRIMEADCAPVFAEPGYLVFTQGGKVMAQRFDTRRLELTGEQIGLMDAPAASDLTAEPVASASRNRRLMLPVIQPPIAELEWLDRSGATRGRIELTEGDWEVGRLSRDGRSATAMQGHDLWRIDLDRSIATRLKRGIRPWLSTAWSPDARSIALDVETPEGPRMQLIDPAGSGREAPLATSDFQFQEVADWAPDGRTLLLAAMSKPIERKEGTQWDLWTIPIEGGAPESYVRSPSFERVARISPDGKWAAWTQAESGHYSVFIDSYPQPGHRVQVGRARGLTIHWGRRGEELLYPDGSGDLVSVPLRLVGDRLEPGAAERLFRIPLGVRSMDTRDGERFLVSRPSGAVQARSLRLLLDWTGLLSR